MSPRAAKWRHTQASKRDLALAIVAAVAALVVLVLGVQSWRRARAVDEASRDFHRSAAGAEAALHALSDGLDSFPDEPALLLLRGAALAERARGAETNAGGTRGGGGPPANEADLAAAGEAFRTLAELAEGSSAGERQQTYGALGVCGRAALLLERARREPDAAARARLLDEAERAASRAQSLGARRPDPKALLGAVALERGDLEAAIARFDEARRGGGPPTKGALLTLYVCEAEAWARKGDPARAAALLERAVVLAPAPARARDPLVDRLARMIARRTCDPLLPQGEPRKAAIADARRALINVERRESGKQVPLYRLENRHVVEIRRAIGVAEARAGLLDDARRTLEQALRDAPSAKADWDGKTPPAARIARDLGAVLVLLWKAETRDQAKKDLARKAGEALRTAADGVEVEAPREAFELHLTAGALFGLAGTPEAAVAELKRADKIDPADFRLRRAIAIAYDLSGRRKEAIDAYRTAIEKAPAPDAATELAERVGKLGGKIP